MINIFKLIMENAEVFGLLTIVLMGMGMIDYMSIMRIKKNESCLEEAEKKNEVQWEKVSEILNRIDKTVTRLETIVEERGK